MVKKYPSFHLKSKVSSIDRVVKMTKQIIDLNLKILDMDNLDKIGRNARMAHEGFMENYARFLPKLLYPTRDGRLKVQSCKEIDNQYLPVIEYDLPLLGIKSQKGNGYIRSFIEFHLENNMFTVDLQITVNHDALDPVQLLNELIKIDRKNEFKEDYSYFDYFWEHEICKFAWHKHATVKEPVERWESNDFVSYNETMTWEKKFTLSFHCYIPHYMDLGEWSFLDKMGGLAIISPDDKLNLDDPRNIEKTKVDNSTLEDIIKYEAELLKPENLRKIIEEFFEALKLELDAELTQDS